MHIKNSIPYHLTKDIRFIIMKIKIIILALIFCQSALGKSFSTVDAKHAPVNLVGNWSGKVGPFKSNFRINKDGNGLFCYSSGKLNKVEKIKYSHNVIYTQRDTSVNIEELDDKIMLIEVNNFGSVNYMFVKDPKLKKASRYCQGRLRW